MADVEGSRTGAELVDSRSCCSWMPLADYAASWIRHRPGLRGKTIVLYDGLLRNHIKPHLGEKRLNQLTGPMLRAWRTDLLDNGLGPVTAAKAYRLLRSILATE